jgi:hypothetical protein
MLILSEGLTAELPSHSKAAGHNFAAYSEAKKNRLKNITNTTPGQPNSTLPLPNANMNQSSSTGQDI